MHFLKIIAALACFASSFPLSYAAPISEEPTSQTEIFAEQAQELAQLDLILTSIPAQTQRIRLILAAIVQKCEPTLLKNINHALVRSWALTMQQALKEMHDLPIGTPPNIFIKAHVNFYCAQLITQAIQMQLTKIPEFTRESCLKALAPECNLEQLIRLETQTQRLLTNLEPAVRNLGLTISNKVTRSAEVIWKEYKLASRLPLLFGVGALILSAKLLSMPIEMSGKTPAETISYPHFYDYIKDLSHSAFSREFLSSSVGYMASGVAGTTVGAAWGVISQAKHTISSSITDKWNKLKGTESILDASGYQAIDDATITFESEELIGTEEQQKEIQPILDCCMNLDDFVRRGNSPQYGTLLIGPSGCGKTMFSRALAGTIHQLCKQHGQAMRVMFKELSCVDLWRMSLRDHIAQARKQGGVVVLFIDEIHNLSMQTHKNSFSLNDFLTQMADLYNTDVPNSYVFLIAATNQPELLGGALLVPGRFGKIVRFSYPSAAKRTELFKRLLPRAGINPEEIDIASLVRQTSESVSFGKLRSIINEARIKAEGSGEVVGQKHLQEAIDALVHRFKQSFDVTPTEKKMIAAYQASKALAYTMLATNLKVERVTIGGINHEVQEHNEYTEAGKHNPNKSSLYIPAYGSVILYRQQEALQADDILEQKKQCKALVAGSCGQDLLLNTHSATYNAPDMQQAIKLAQEIVLDGKCFEDLSEHRQNEVKDQAEALVATYQQEMHQLLAMHKDALNALVEKLEKEITISGEDTQAILKQFVVAGM